MFTGIIQDQGKIVEIQSTPQGKSFWIHSTLDAAHFSNGNSIAVNGVCLTVEAYDNGRFKATAVPETLNLTTLGDAEVGDEVNLEAPLTLATPIAGHLVSGHVDGMGRVLESGPDFWIEVPHELKKYIAHKGSLTLNGVSLTVAEVVEDHVRIALIPETLERTNLGHAEKVNLEVDLLARYLESLTQAG